MDDDALFADTGDQEEDGQFVMYVQFRIARNVRILTAWAGLGASSPTRWATTSSA